MRDIYGTIILLLVIIPVLCFTVYSSIAGREFKIISAFCKILSIILGFFVISSLCRLHCDFHTTEIETEEIFEIINTEKIEHGYEIVYMDGNDENIIEFKSVYDVFDVMENTSENDDYIVKMTEECNSPKIIQKLALFPEKNMLMVYTSNREMVVKYNKATSLSSLENILEIICVIMMAVYWFWGIYAIWYDKKRIIWEYEG